MNSDLVQISKSPTRNYEFIAKGLIEIELGFAINQMKFK